MIQRGAHGPTDPDPAERPGRHGPCRLQHNVRPPARRRQRRSHGDPPAPADARHPPRHARLLRHRARLRHHGAPRCRARRHAGRLSAHGRRRPRWRLLGHLHGPGPADAGRLSHRPRHGADPRHVDPEDGRRPSRQVRTRAHRRRCGAHQRQRQEDRLHLDRELLRAGRGHLAARHLLQARRAHGRPGAQRHQPAGGLNQPRRTRHEVGRPLAHGPRVS